MGTGPERQALSERRRGQKRRREKGCCVQGLSVCYRNCNCNVLTCFCFNGALQCGGTAANCTHFRFLRNH